MKYLLLSYLNETAMLNLPKEAASQMHGAYMAYTEAMKKAGAYVGNSGLRPTSDATTVIWLGRLVVSLLPQEPEALGLLSLMLHAEARREARRDEQGEFIPLDRQDPARWDAALIDEAEALLLRASRMSAADRFQLEAAVQSAHAARRLTGRTDWVGIVQLYDALLGLTDSVVVAINRAVALARVRGAAEGLATLNALQGDGRLAEYQPYWAARAALLAHTGSADEAAEAHRRAIGLESDPAVRRFLQDQLAKITFN